jgi:hypothetical protein
VPPTSELDFLLLPPQRIDFARPGILSQWRMSTQLELRNTDGVLKPAKALIDICQMTTRRHSERILLATQALSRANQYDIVTD